MRRGLGKSVRVVPVKARPRVPVRTCVGCRRRADQDHLVRYVLDDGRAILDRRARLPGRGAWLHADPRCWERALRTKAFARALRAAVTSVEEIETTEAAPDGP